MIERLKKIAAEEKQNAVREGSDGLIGEEEAEEVAPQTYVWLCALFFVLLNSVLC